jgi:hypothetical protein
MCLTWDWVTLDIRRDWPTLSRVKGIALFTLALILGAYAATSARATGQITITWATTQNRHVYVEWDGPYLSYGAVVVARGPDTGPDGQFLPENVVQSALFDAGDGSWLFSNPIRAGTYWVRVYGRDDMCHSYDRGNGLIGWIGCDTFSDIVKFKLVCKKNLFRRGHYTYRNGRRIWHKPVYKTVCW